MCGRFGTSDVRESPKRKNTANINMREAHTASVYPLRNAFWPQDTHLKTFNSFRLTPQSTGFTVLDTCLLLGRQTVTESILRNTVHRLFTALCSPSILPTGGQEYCTNVSHNILDRLAHLNTEIITTTTVSSTAF